MPELKSLLEIKEVLRNGPYAFPGGYPLYFVTSDGEVLSFKAVKDNWQEIVRAHLRNDRRGGWHLAGFDTNWEDEDLTCSHTNEKIEVAYPSDEPEGDPEAEAA